MTSIKVTKREGHTEDLDLEKLHKVVFWATQGITGVSASEVEIKSHIQFYNGIKTADIQETLIKSAADLISEETPNYQYVAGRLINYHLRKQVYNSYVPCNLLNLVKKNVASGFYDKGLLEAYSEAEWHTLDTYIHHDRDEPSRCEGVRCRVRGPDLLLHPHAGDAHRHGLLAHLRAARRAHSRLDAQRRRTLRAGGHRRFHDPGRHFGRRLCGVPSAVHGK